MRISVCEVESLTLVLFDGRWALPRWLYTGLLRLLLPVVFIRLWLRGRQTPAYRLRWRERLGFAPTALRPDLAPIWIHAVSVGETLAAQPLVNALRERYPTRPILITTMTPTGSERVRAIWGDAVWHVYAPYDYPAAIRRFLRHWQPQLLIVMETELWPNWLAQARQEKLPVLLANARLSARSALGYGRLSRLSTELMQNLTLVAAQDEASAERFRGLGVPAQQVLVTGSMKFDLSVSEAVLAQAQQLRMDWAMTGRRVWVAASTHVGEDALMLAAQAQICQSYPDALLILVPRHPERFESVARQVAQRFTLVRRSSGEPVSAQTSILLGDSMGELLLWLAMADVCFMGGSLVPSGGHNALEPLAFGVATLTGPHFFNFDSINQTLLSAGALAVVTDADSLAKAVCELFADESLALSRRQAGLHVLAANRGALQRQVALCERLLAQSPRA